MVVGWTLPQSIKNFQEVASRPLFFISSACRLVINNEPAVKIPHHSTPLHSLSILILLPPFFSKEEKKSSKERSDSECEGYGTFICCPWLTTLLCLPSTLLSSSFQKVDHQNEILFTFLFYFHLIIFILLQFEEFCNLSRFRLCRCNGSYVHIREQMRLHCLAWNSRLSKAGQHRL